MLSSLNVRSGLSLLGHIVFGEGIKVDTQKKEAMQNWS